MKNKDPNRKNNKLRRIFNKVGKARPHVPKIVKETFKDLRNKKELGLFITAVILPGGMFAYAGYRAKKYFDKRAANDNKPAQPKNDKNRKPPSNKNGFRL